MPVPESLYDELLDLVDPSLLHRSGEVFLSGRTAFEGDRPLYLLGLNPGGDPNQIDWKIERAISDGRTRDDWSAYADESWQGRPPGEHPHQRSVLHLLSGCGLDARTVPASNTIFPRTARESHLAAEKAELFRTCWPVHQRAIDALRVGVVACLGQGAAGWVRQRLDAHEQIDSFTETNRRAWSSTTHEGRDGMQVVTLTHPSIAHWTNPDADPTALVLRALARA